MDGINLLKELERVVEREDLNYINGRLDRSLSEKRVLKNRIKELDSEKCHDYQAVCVNQQEKLEKMQALSRVIGFIVAAWQDKVNIFRDHLYGSCAIVGTIKRQTIIQFEDVEGDLEGIVEDYSHKKKVIDSVTKDLSAYVEYLLTTDEECYLVPRGLVS